MESPLEVLSRAASMVENTHVDERRSPGSDDTKKTERFRNIETQYVNAKARKLGINDTPQNRTADFYTGSSDVCDLPLDMTTSKRSHKQTVNSACVQRPSVITCIKASSGQDGSSPAGSPKHDDSSDPVIDEHFRRSLGKDYQQIFKSTSPEPKSKTTDSPSTGLSVDDHFAKALGDTWLRLQENKDKESLLVLSPKVQ